VIKDPYSARVRDFFASPGHSGDLRGGLSASVVGQGVRLSLSATTAQGTIQSLRFRAWGCPHVIAAAEAFCAEYEGRSVEELQAFTASQLMQSLPVPVEKTGRILVLEDAVRLLKRKVRDATGRKDIRD